jgi:hypothetical protein
MKTAGALLIVGGLALAIWTLSGAAAAAPAQPPQKA